MRVELDFAEGFLGVDGDAELWLSRDAELWLSRDAELWLSLDGPKAANTFDLDFGLVVGLVVDLLSNESFGITLLLINFSIFSPRG